MRPALQRLLQRPSSLEFLRYLVETHTPPATTHRQVIHRTRISYVRHHSVAAFGAQEVEDPDHESNESNAKNIALKPIPPSVDTNPHHMKAKTEYSYRRMLKKPDHAWKESMWTRQEIEYESNLEEKDPSKPKLLDDPIHHKDLRLWACLLDYRKRIYGHEGVRMFWRAVKNGTLELPGSGNSARKIWLVFLDLGFEDDEILHEVWNYADRILDTAKTPTGKRSRIFYPLIVQHMLLTGRGEEAKQWHDRLIEKQAPNEEDFARICHVVMRKGGDRGALGYIYERNNFRNLYRNIVPILCAQENFDAALDWHFFLLRCGDKPKALADVVSLTTFLTTYRIIKAREVAKSLVEAGVSFASSLSLELEAGVKTSREMMNLVYGKVLLGGLQVPAREYNDSLGARWFATTWVSLDVSLNAVHALGMQQIGPLSLQAIALRDPSVKGVTTRLNQLQDLGISIGNSKFSKAVEKFARAGNEQYLEGLLRSDQHPDELEDRLLQEKLLVSYARIHDWPQYHRTLAIMSLGEKSPSETTENVRLRNVVEVGDVSAVLAYLRKMQIRGIHVGTTTTYHILSRILQPRRRGKRPVMPSTPRKDLKDDLPLVIQILKGIMESGNFVPMTYWREVIKRLGIMNRFNELADLCTYLASWYNPANHKNMPDGETEPRIIRYYVPASVPNSNPLHPLKILFPRSLQGAIVEWGIIRTMRNRQAPRPGRFVPHITDGIELLKRLQERGVYINRRAIRLAVLNRLVIYYGPGLSDRKHNRVARAYNMLSLSQMASQISASLGRQLAMPHPEYVLSFPQKESQIHATLKRQSKSMSLDRLVYKEGRRRLRRRAQKQKRRGKTGDPRLAFTGGIRFRDGSYFSIQ